jgi:tryptophanyl-tRNA synthetase
MSKKVILSGMRPTGKLHLGHLLGALENWKTLQHEFKCFYMIADLHALTTAYQDTSQIYQNILDILIDWLSAGIDPEKCIIFRQSHIPEHSELFFLLSTFTPIPWLERNPTYKEQQIELKNVDLSTFAFLGYPVLQAADILLYKSTHVPIGQDQLPHLELTREIARRFHHLYQKEIFPLPQPLLTQTPKLPGIDGRKMSKSYNNCIYLADSGDTLHKKVRSMITDPARQRRHDPGHPEVCTIFQFQKTFNDDNRVKQIEEECRDAKIGCTDCKEEIYTILQEKLKPVHQKREELEKDPIFLNDILNEGRENAQKVAQQTIKEVRRVMKID